MSVTPDTCPADISEQDVIDAMKGIPGYIDITPGDFRTIYHIGLPQGARAPEAGRSGRGTS